MELKSERNENRLTRRALEREQGKRERIAVGTQRSENFQTSPL